MGDHATLWSLIFILEMMKDHVTFTCVNHVLMDINFTCWSFTWSFINSLFCRQAKEDIPFSLNSAFDDQRTPMVAGGGVMSPMILPQLLPLI